MSNYSMSTKEALSVVIDIASRWGENVEEGFTRRIQSSDSDEAAGEAAEGGGNEAGDGVEVRNLWRAIDTINRILEQKGCEHLDKACDGSLTDLCDIIVFG